MNPARISLQFTLRLISNCNNPLTFIILRDISILSGKTNEEEEVPFVWDDSENCRWWEAVRQLRGMDF